MTGFGDARAERDDYAVAVEIRAVNSRHLKLNTRISEGYSALESHIEPIVRRQVHRGTVYVNVRVRQLRAAEDYRINTGVLEAYLDSLQELAAGRDLSEELRLEPLALLPGVVEEAFVETRNADAVWPIVQGALDQAIAALRAMREVEGNALESDLSNQLNQIATSLSAIEQRAPEVIEQYRTRLEERVGDALDQVGAEVDPADLVREVCLFADRADISEEIVRMRSHLDQFRGALNVAESAGKRLEFIVQEIGRETNTIGSKANDAEISHQVVEIKTALERVREQVQNVE